MTLKLSNLKIFGEEFQGLDDLEMFNLIVGKNNSGKSTFLEAAARACSGDLSFPTDDWRGGSLPTLRLSSQLSSSYLESVWRSAHHQATPSGVTPQEIFKQLDGIKIEWDENLKSKSFSSWNYDEFGDPFQIGHGLNQITKNAIIQFQIDLVGSAESDLRGFNVERLSSERNVRYEPMYELDYFLPNGDGATSFIVNHINRASLSSDIVEVDLLQMLNQICFPDFKYDRITCQIRDKEPDKDQWEIYLHFGDKKIALSKMGSGLKTIILVLILILRSRKHESNVFLLEELETSLHPSLIRNLMDFLYNYGLDKEIYFFITTHSNIPIDLFFKKTKSQVMYFSTQSDSSNASKINTLQNVSTLLVDLDFKASDLFLTNCVIWVEGPSDKLYLQKWIELLSEDDLREGEHYVCIFYGGRLLSHLSYEAKEGVDSKINVFKVNRNNFVLIDSDKKAADNKLNDTKIRVILELADQDSCWVTAGKEIENYLSSDLIARAIGVPAPDLSDEYVNVYDQIDLVKPGEGSKWKAKKVDFAAKVTEKMQTDDLGNILDLSKCINLVIKFISDANGLKTTS